MLDCKKGHSGSATAEIHVASGFLSQRVSFTLCWRTFTTCGGCMKEGLLELIVAGTFFIKVGY